MFALQDQWELQEGGLQAPHLTFLHSVEEQLSNTLRASLCSVQTINSFLLSGEYSAVDLAF